MQKDKLKEIEYKLAAKNYVDYVQLVHDGLWKKSRFGKFLCEQVQKFVEKKTGHPYDIMILNVPPQSGKALLYETPVLTTKGWKLHGELEVGDYVYSPDGRPVKVLSVQKPYYHPCMKIVFDSGDEFICAREHEWPVSWRHQRKKHGKHYYDVVTENIETQHIFDRKYIHGKPFIQIGKAIEGEAKDLLIDPYRLGVWLGDGESKGIRIACGEEDLENMLENLGVDRYAETDPGNYNISLGVTDGSRGSNAFRNALKEYGIWGKKHIPADYFNASVEQRIALLQGLMDTDGTVDGNYARCEFCATRKQLAYDVFYLIRSLGIKCSIRLDKAKLNGREISDRWRINFTPHKDDIIFRLKRKQQRINNKSTDDRSVKERFFIKEIVDYRQCEVNCITVEGGLYMAGAFIPTHNSMTVTSTLPSWYLGKYPHGKVIEISYNTDYARQFGRQNREKIREYGDHVFGVKVASRPSGELEFELDNHVGSMISRGVDAGVTGRGCTLMIIDDPIKNRKEADSPTTRDRLWAEWTDSYRSRLAPGAKVIVIMTRWHMADLAGQLIEKEDNVTVLNLPLEAEKKDPMGRAEGEALHPEIGKDDKWMRNFKETLIKSKGMRTWEALYQGHPTIEEGNMVKREWWRYYDELPSGAFEIISVDATFKDSDRADFVAIQVWGKVGANYYLIDRVKKRMDFVSTLNAIKYMRSAHPHVAGILVEDKANGPAIMSILKRDIPGIIPVDPAGGKVARVNAVSPAIESGSVFLPSDKPWVQEFVEEFAAFPNGAHDDEVDCCTQALNRLIYTYTVVEAPKEEDLEILQPKKQLFGVPIKVRSLFH